MRWYLVWYTPSPDALLGSSVASGSHICWRYSLREIRWIAGHGAMAAQRSARPLGGAQWTGGGGRRQGENFRLYFG